MKSAYELAMERLQKEDPRGAAPLSEEQKAELAEVDRRFQARLAEREVFLQGQIAKARAEGNAKDLAELETQWKHERARLEEEKEEAKNRVRGE